MKLPCLLQKCSFFLIKLALFWPAAVLNLEPLTITEQKVLRPVELRRFTRDTIQLSGEELTFLQRISGITAWCLNPKP